MISGGNVYSCLLSNIGTCACVPSRVTWHFFARKRRVRTIPTIPYGALLSPGLKRLEPCGLALLTLAIRAATFYQYNHVQLKKKKKRASRARESHYRFAANEFVALVNKTAEETY